MYEKKEFIGEFIDAKKRTIKCYKYVMESGEILLGIDSPDGKVELGIKEYIKLVEIAEICFTGESE